MLYQFILLIHVFIGVFIIALVLVQQGKGATMGAAFGSGASQTIFGSRGSGSFLFRVTIGCAAVFFITSISLNSLTMHAYKQERVVNLPVPVNTEAPASSAPQDKTSEIPVRK
jgi:preprotein translocase subunit SecG